MNIRITTYSLIVAVGCGIAFNQVAKAEEQDVRNVPSMRFDFGSNTYALDRVQSRHHSIGTFTPSSVKSGAVPKNMLGLDPGFVKAAPPPPAPVAQPVVAAKPIFPAPFSSLFGRPTNTPLVASAPGVLPVATPAQAARPAGHLPSRRVTTSLTPKLIHAAKPTALAAAPASYSNLDKFYKQGSVVPGYGGSSSGNGVVSTSLNGSIIPKHR